MKKGVSADSTFYIAFLDENEINMPEILEKILSKMDFYAGPIIIERELKNYRPKYASILSKVTKINFDFITYLEPILYGIVKPEEKGEYEAIGIALFLKNMGCLSYLILDDKGARKLVERYSEEIKEFMVWSTQFICILCCEEKVIQRVEAEKILKTIYDLAEDENKTKKPFYITKKNRDKILKPLLEKIKKC